MKRGVRFLMGAVFCLIMVIAVVYATLFLWNWLIPTLFNGPEITIWQAVGLLILTKILFSGFGRKCHCGGHKYGGYWKQRLSKKFSDMSPEEREEFKRKMKTKWCYTPSEKEEGEGSNRPE